MGSEFDEEERLDEISGLIAMLVVSAHESGRPFPDDYEQYLKMLQRQYDDLSVEIDPAVYRRIEAMWDAHKDYRNRKN